jgi:hypothetical protein
MASTPRVGLANSLVTMATNIRGQGREIYRERREKVLQAERASSDKEYIDKPTPMQISKQ